MSKKPKKTERETEHGISYKAWDDDALKNFPVKKEHIGRPIKLASDPNSKYYDLIEIKEPGDEGFPRGGYSVTDPELAFPKSIFLDEAISFPPKKKKKKKKAKKRKTKK